MFPEDEYLLSLGRATWAFASLEWMIVYLSQALQPGSRRANLSTGLTAPRVADLLREALALRSRSDEVLEEAASIAADFESLVPRRNDVIHAHPATIDDMPRLHRVRKDGSQESIRGEDLEAFVVDCEALGLRANRLYHEMVNGERT